MATTYTTTEHDRGAETAYQRLGSQTVYDRIPVGAAIAINDLFKSLHIPKGAIITDAWIETPQLDEHNTPTLTLTLRINDGTTQKNFFAASTVGQAGGIARADAAGGAVGYEVGAAGFYLELLAAAAAATTVTDSAGVFVGLSYTMNRIHADI